MKAEERQKLREAARRATTGAVSTDGSWQLQTSNSWRRIGNDRSDGGILCPTTHRIDGHPDLTAAPGVLDYIIAAQPSVVLELLDQLDAAEHLLSRLAEVEARLDETDRKFRDAQIIVEKMREMARIAANGGVP